jgi:tetratricopeptide (TPR) repeat protein
MTRAVIVKALRGLALSLTCVLVVACATSSGVSTPDSASAIPAPEHFAATESASASQEKAITAYRDFLARYPDSPEHDSITRRLADLLLEQAADLHLQLATATATTPADAARLEAEAKQAYAAAISHYEYLLQKDPHGPQSTAALYQLSRAYQESGQSQQALTAIDRLLARQADTNSRLLADTRFRRGELLFGQGDYLEAGRSYQGVVDLGTSVPAYDQSLYKLGWSLFKQERYRDALPMLFSSLEGKIAPAGAYDAQLASLSPADREQVADLLRVISRSFAQLGGVDAVDKYFRSNGGRSYEQQIYMALGAWYVDQEQVSEAARTWLVLAQRNPLGTEAPRLTARTIKLYRQAGFQQRVVELETVFVQTYGMDSEFWTIHSPADFPDVVQLLQSSLRELARLSHEQVRSTGDADQVRPLMREAEQWYRQYLASFGDEAAAAEMNFQLAELLYENGQYQQALDEYERTAWSRGAHARAIDAALGALHANGKLLQHAGAAEQAALSEHSTTGALRFLTNYPDHPAAPGLLAQTGTVLLEQQQYDRALLVSEHALAESASTSTALRQVAWSLRAQALFATLDYPVAAVAYREALQLAGKDDARRPALQEGLAMATYRQAGQALTLGDQGSAIALYQQAAELAPNASLRSKAEYDAATTLLAQESWAQAIRLLDQFRDDYPDDPLQQEVTRKLAYAYERSGDNSQAANEYLRLGLDRRQAETLQREALLRAVELYRQAGAIRQTISASERYLERFPEPAAVAVGVMQQLADLESGNGDPRRRQYWLQAIVSLDRTAGSSRTRAPAAEAALELAQQRLIAFQRVQLVNPVQDSLAQKIAAMKRALQAFEAAIDYGISPVTTAATYHIASMYDELGRALLTSERPASLTAEELAEYDVLLVKQAAPFEQQAIDIYTSNTQRFDGDPRDPWIAKSVRQLDELRSGR